jgi:hypothetical protein
MSPRYPAPTLLLAMLAARTWGAAPEALTDPTRPALAGATHAALAEASSVHVQAIFIRPGLCVAIVNGRLVRAGDRIASVLIEAVTPTGVRYLQAGHPGFAAVHEAKLDLHATSAHKTDSP